jgi:hypothetical protein
VTSPIYILDTRVVLNVFRPKEAQQRIFNAARLFDVHTNVHEWLVYVCAGAAHRARDYNRSPHKSGTRMYLLLFLSMPPKMRLIAFDSCENIHNFCALYGRSNMDFMDWSKNSKYSCASSCRPTV